MCGTNMAPSSQLLPSLRRPRYYHGLAAFEGVLYAIGGLSAADGDVMADVEALDLTGGAATAWRAVAACEACPW